MNNIDDFIKKWDELQNEKTYMYNRLLVSDAKYIDEHYNFDLNKLFYDKNYGNEAYLKKTQKGKHITELKKHKDLALMLAIRCYVAYKNPEFIDFLSEAKKNYSIGEMLIANEYNLEYFNQIKCYSYNLSAIGYNPEKFINNTEPYIVISNAMKFIKNKDQYFNNDCDSIVAAAIEYSDIETISKNLEILKNKGDISYLRLVRKGFFLDEAMKSNNRFIVSSAIDSDQSFDEKKILSKFKITTKECDFIRNSIDSYNLRHGELKNKYYHNAINTLLNNKFKKYWHYVVQFGDYSNKIRLIEKISETNQCEEFLDKLVLDKSFQVRIAILKLNIPKYINILKNDTNEYVQLVLKEQINDKI